MRKVKIKSLPKAGSGLEVKLSAGLGYNSNTMPWPIMAGKLSQPDIEVNNTLSPVNREDANLEAELGETAFTDKVGDGIPQLYKIGGERHYNGGTPLNLPDDSFIFSRDNKMKIGGDILNSFGKPKGTKDKYTPADLSKQYDINSFRGVLADPDTDKIQRETAERMIANYNLKLGKLGLVQESKKGFPDGIPAISMPYLEMLQVDPSQFVSPQGAPDQPDADNVAKYGGGLYKAPLGKYITKGIEQVGKIIPESVSDIWGATKKALYPENLTKYITSAFETKKAPYSTFTTLPEQDLGYLLRNAPKTAVKKVPTKAAMEQAVNTNAMINAVNQRGTKEIASNLQSTMQPYMDKAYGTAALAGLAAYPINAWYDKNKGNDAEEAAAKYWGDPTISHMVAPKPVIKPTKKLTPEQEYQQWKASHNKHALGGPIEEYDFGGSVKANGPYLEYEDGTVVRKHANGKDEIVQHARPDWVDPRTSQQQAPQQNQAPQPTSRPTKQVDPNSEFDDAIEVFTEHEQANNQSSKVGFVGGGDNWGTNDPTIKTKEEAKKLYKEKYWPLVKDLPPGLRTRALQLAINTGDPYGELLVASGKMDPLERKKLVDEANAKGLKGYDKTKYITDKRLAENSNDISNINSDFIKKPNEFFTKLNAEQKRYYGNLTDYQDPKFQKFYGEYTDKANQVASKYIPGTSNIDRDGKGVYKSRPGERTPEGIDPSSRWTLPELKQRYKEQGIDYENMSDAEAQAALYDKADPFEKAYMWGSIGNTNKGQASGQTAKFDKYKPKEGEDYPTYKKRLSDSGYTSETLNKELDPFKSSFADSYRGVREAWLLSPYKEKAQETPETLKTKTETKTDFPEYDIKNYKTPPAEWWRQDQIKTAGAFGDLMRIKKYQPWQATPGVAYGERTFFDPTRELAANMEGMNQGIQGAATFTGPQGFAATAGYLQGQGAKNAADIMGRYNNLNVTASNQLSDMNTDIFNRASQQRAQNATGLYDKQTIANQQFDNSKNLARQNLRQSYIDAITNRANTYNLNTLYPQYAVNPSDGGMAYNIPDSNRALNKNKTASNDYISQMNAINEAALSDEDKTILKEGLFKKANSSNSQSQDYPNYYPNYPQRES